MIAYTNPPHILSRQFTTDADQFKVTICTNHFHIEFQQLAHLLSIIYVNVVCK